MEEENVKAATQRHARHNSVTLSLSKGALVEAWTPAFDSGAVCARLRLTLFVTRSAPSLRKSGGDDTPSGEANDACTARGA